MLYLQHVFGKFTLQTGTVLCSTLFTVSKCCSLNLKNVLIIFIFQLYVQTLAVCVFFVNVLSIEADEPCMQNVFIYITKTGKIVFLTI